MKDHAAFSISATALSKIGKLMATVIDRRMTIPVLSYCRVAVKKNKVTFTASDLDVEVSKTIEAEDTTTGVMLLPLYLLRDAAQMFSGRVEISVHLGEGVLKATDGTTNVRLSSLIPPEDFPRMSDWEKLVKDEADMDEALSQADLLRVFDLTRHCVSTEETRYYLNGVYLCAKPEGQTLRAVATDGHRMAVIDTSLSVPKETAAIIPRKAAHIIQNNLDATANETAALRLRGKRVQVAAGDLTITSKCIDGTFPDYTRVLPKKKVAATVALTASAVRRISSFKRAVHGPAISLPVVFSSEHQTMSLGKNGNRIELPCDIKSLGEKPMAAFGFNDKLLGSQASVTPVMRLEMANPSDPSIIRVDDPDALWVLMPMRV